MSRIAPPLKVGTTGFGLRWNTTLHGRSVYRPANVSGHNVFKGYTTTGKGDGVDCFAPAGTPVYAMHDGVQTRWANDMTKKEVIYIEGGGITTVYAHINASHEGVGMSVRRGDRIGTIRGDLNDPHLHLEVWINGTAVAAKSGKELAAKLADLCAVLAEEQPLKVVLLPGNEVIECEARLDGEPSVRVNLRKLAEALGFVVTDHIGDQGKVYLTKEGE